MEKQRYIQQVRCMFISLLFLAAFTIQLKAQNGFRFYQEGGKWGVLYQNEPCLLPIYNQVAEIQRGGLFFYKENGKWGIANVWKRISEPFCDSLMCFRIERLFDTPPIETDLRTNKKHISDIFIPDMSKNIIQYRFLSNGKWGICSVDGKTIIPAIYDDIDEDLFYYYDFGLYYKDVKKKNPIMLDNKYYLVKSNDNILMVDICNSIILQNISSFEFFKSKEGLKKYKKMIFKNEKERGKDSEAINTIKTQVIYTNEKTNENVLFRNSVSYNYDFNKPREIYFGYRNGELLTPSGETLTICGQKSIANEYGFIGIPLVYDSPEYRLQRNPLDIFSLADLVDRETTQLSYGHYINYIDEKEVRSGVAEQDLILLQRKIKSFSELMEMAKNIGDENAYNYVKQRKDDTQARYDKYKANYDYKVKIINFNAKVDRISGIATSFLNTMINAMGGNSSTSSTTYSSSIGIANDKKQMKTNTSPSMSMSDQVNYNSLRNTYNKWAMDLMQMKSLSGKYQKGYTSNDKQHAQSEMKRIRKDAMKKWGKEIPYNSIEDWIANK